MISKHVSRRLLLGYMGAAAISLLATNVQAGDFRYEPRDERSWPGAEKSWPRNMIRAVQTQLNELGFDSGPADGLYGPKTKSAIKEFQRSEDLDVDGKISDELIRDLELGR